MIISTVAATISNFVDKTVAQTQVKKTTPMLATSAAIANAVYHATGKRVRDLPITLDKLL